jgi:hypothetical protein
MMALPSAVSISISLRWALAVLRNTISVDDHSHGGKTVITSKALPSDDLANAMRAGSLAIACLADVPDWPVLGRSAAGAVAVVRTPEPGELYRYHLDRLAWIDELVSAHGVRHALNAADLEAAHRVREPAIIADVEGLDFLEGKLERLEEAHRRAIRHVQLVHYTPNGVGDFQTGTIAHQGLTEFGAEVIRACNRLGVVCDVAHTTEDGKAGGQGRDKAAAPVAHYTRWVHLVGDAARRLHPRGGRQDRRRRLSAHLSCRGRLNDCLEPLPGIEVSVGGGPGAP